MKIRTIVLMVALVSLATLATAFEPVVDEPPLSRWIQSRCKVRATDVTFSWNTDGFIVAYGRSPTVSCSYKVLYKTALSDQAVQYTLVGESDYCNRFYIVTIDQAGGYIHEMWCLTAQPDSLTPSGDFLETRYVF